MLRLHTLGGLRLSRPDGSPAAWATPRRLALLALVGAAGTRGVSRDRVIALLWSEQDSDRARHNLAQLLYAMRQDFGGSPPVVGTTELRLDPDRLTADVAEFDSAVDAGDDARAAALYEGPFLDGFYLSGAPELERWVEDERTRLAGRAHGAMERVARAAVDRGDHAGAVAAWQRLALLDPHSGRVTAGLMEALADSGDRGGALRVGRQFARRVREELEVAPDPAVVELAARLAGDDPVAAPTPISRAPAGAPSEPRAVPSPGPQAPAVPTPHAAARPRRRFAVPGGAVLIALVAAAFALRRDGSSGRPVTLVLAGVDNQTGDTLFDRSLHTAATVALQQSAHVSLLARGRISAALARMGQDPLPESALPESLAVNVASREGADGVVVLSILPDAGGYRIALRVTDPETREDRVTESERAGTRDAVLGALDAALRRVRRSLGERRSSVASTRGRLPDVTTPSLEALRAYADGNDAWRRGEYDQANLLWSRAVVLDSSFAMAHGALGRYWYFHNDRPQGEASYRRALALRQRLSEREVLQLEASYADARRDHARSIAAEQTLVQRFPNEPPLWYNLGTSFMTANRDTEAINAFETALRLDPKHLNSVINLATVHNRRGDYRTALQYYHQALALDPEALRYNNLNVEYGMTHARLGEYDSARTVFLDRLTEGVEAQQALRRRSLAALAALTGRYDEAITELRQAVAMTSRRGPGLPQYRNRVLLAWAYRARGLHGALQQELREIDRHLETVHLEPTALLFAGRLHVRLGEFRRADQVYALMGSRVDSVNTWDISARRIMEAELHLARGRPAEAVPLLEASRETSAQEGLVLGSLARAYAATGQVDAAFSTLMRLIALAPLGTEAQEEWIDAHLQLARLHQATGARERAGQWYDRYLSLRRDADPDLPELLVVRQEAAQLRGAGER